MELHLAWYGSADKDIERLTLQDDVEQARRLTRDIERGNMVLESWVLRSGGEMVTSNGTRGSAKVPAEHLDELLDIVRQYEEAVQTKLAVGIGSEPAEATIALKVAEKRGGDPAVVLYTPDVAQEAHDLDQVDDSVIGDGAEADVLEDAQEDMAKAQFNDAGEAGEATRIQNGELAPDHAAPSAPSPLTPGSPMSAPEDGQGGAPAGGGQPGQAQDPQQLKQAVAAVLQDVKKQLPTIEQMKQAAPEAYQAITGMVEAMLALAQSRFGGAAAVQSPVQKAEHHFVTEDRLRKEAAKFDAEVEQEMKEHPHLTREEAEKLVTDHYRTRKAEAQPGAKHPYHALTPTKTGHHDLHEPVGTVRDGRVKVVHQDGSTTWVQARAGAITSGDGHPISSRNPGGK